MRVAVLMRIEPRAAHGASYSTVGGDEGGRKTPKFQTIFYEISRKRTTCLSSIHLRAYASNVGLSTSTRQPALVINQI